jgi:hypothetical protein
MKKKFKEQELYFLKEGAIEVSKCYDAIMGNALWVFFLSVKLCKFLKMWWKA